MSKHQRQTAARLTERWGFRILAATLIAVPLVFDGDLLRFTLLPKRLAVQIGLLLLLMLLTRDVLNTDRPCIPRSILNLPTLAYALVTATALLWAGNVVAAIESVSHLLTYVLLFFAAVTTVRREQTPQLAETVCWVGIIVSIIGLGEFWGIDSSIPSNGRPSATFGYRNMAASYLVMAIPFAVGLIATTHSRRTYGIAITSATLMTVFLVYTRTRGAWVALLFAVVVTALFSIPYRPATGSLLSSTWGKRLLAIGALVVLTLSPWEPHLASSRARHIDEGKATLLNALSSASRPGADRGRRAIWSHTLEMIGDRPLMGVGPGNWQYAYPLYDGGDMLRVGSAPERPHNDYLWIAAETGLVGLAAYLWLLAAAGLIFVRAVRDSETRTWGLVIGTSLLASLGHAVFSFPKELAETSLLFWLNLALLVTLDSKYRSQTNVKRLQPAVLIPATIVAAGCLIVTIQAMRFDRRLMEALSYHAGNDLRATLSFASKALEIGPFDTRAHLLQAKGYRATGQYVRAIEAGTEGLRYHPHSPELLGDPRNELRVERGPGRGRGRLPSFSDACPLSLPDVEQPGWGRSAAWRPGGGDHGLPSRHQAEGGLRRRLE